MATPKKVKTITINSTKYKVGGGSEAIFVFNHYDAAEGYYVTDAIKDIEGNTLTNADVCDKVKSGAQIYVQVVAASGSNSGKFQLLDQYEHEEYGEGSVVQEHFWSEDNAFGKYVSMTFRLTSNWVSAPNITDKSDEFVITLDSSNELYSTGAKTCTSFSVAALKAAVDAGKTVRIVGSNLLSEDDVHSETIDLVCSCIDSFQGAQIWLSTMYGTKALSFIVGVGDPDTKTSINLINIFSLNQP